MTGQRYIDEVLLPHVRLFRGVVGDKFVFMDDNATCHRTLAVQDCLDSEGIQRLEWPARSPDLNPIENVWDALGRKVAGRNYPPTNKNTLIRELTEEWDKLPQQLLDNVVQRIIRSYGSVSHQLKDCRTCSNNRVGYVSQRDDDPCREILHCSHQRFIHKQFQVVPEEESKEIEVQEAWRSSNRSTAFNPPTGRCGMEVVTHRN
ncbi:transposable element Tcb2 transposase [Trichonephila clavipes]|nr:transposable element Tcb2 transposase [Trichonephila clavipes]